MDDTDGLADRLGKLCTEAAELRRSVRGGSVGESVIELHERLLETRAATDRVEEIVASVGRLRARTASDVADCAEALEDVYAKVVTAPGARGVDDYSSAREREASYSLKTIDQKLGLRRAQRVDREVAAALDYCRTLHRGLNDTGRTLGERIRLMTMDRYLEKG